jgi:hypothetical protein
MRVGIVICLVTIFIGTSTLLFSQDHPSSPEVEPDSDESSIEEGVTEDPGTDKRETTESPTTSDNQGDMVELASDEQEGDGDQTEVDKSPIAEPSEKTDAPDSSHVVEQESSSDQKTMHLPQRFDVGIQFTIGNIFDFSIASLKGSIGAKFMLFEWLALRARLRLNMGKWTDQTDFEGSNTVNEKDVLQTIGFGIGAEYHFRMHPRLSPYAGLTFHLTSEQSQKTVPGIVDGDKTVTTLKSLTLGARAIIGIELLLFRHFGFFLEYGLGFDYFNREVKESVVEDEVVQSPQVNSTAGWIVQTALENEGLLGFSLYF